jgi:GTP pyrophosphokinase
MIAGKGLSDTAKRTSFLVETITLETDRDGRAGLAGLGHALSGLAPSGAAGTQACAEGLAVAAIVASYDSDPTLLGACALKPLLVAGLCSPVQAAVALPQEAVALALELAKLGQLELTPAAMPAGAVAAPALDGAQAETVRRMLLAVVTDPRLVLARLAEQLLRLRQAKAADAAERARLATATQAVYAPLANRLGLGLLKWELEDYAFRYLAPLDYRRIANSLNERRVERERYIAELKARLRAELGAAGIAADIQGRAKHIYSIWRKMTRKQLLFEQVFDVRAVRILVEGLAECYAALGIVHGLWPYVPGEFDDYIATPKPNGYRSIHTAVLGPGGKTVEIQIRTHEMHARSELGLAAHWRYKEGVRQDLRYDRKLERLRRLLSPGAPSERGDGEQDFLDRLSDTLFRDRVYVFSPKGEVIELPAGATPLDFAYQVHTELGHRCKGARVNGRLVPLDHRLQNGEAVEIVAGKQPAPSRDWLVESLGFLVTRSARAKVRAFFRRQDEGSNRRVGRELIERELAKAAALGPVSVPELLGELRLADADELYRLAGEGEISAAQVAGALQRRLRGPGQETRPAPVAPLPAPVAAGVDVMGIGDLLSSYARCCRPVPPERIVGYVTLGRGVTIHRAECRNLARLGTRQPDRVFAVSWGAPSERLYPAEFTVQAMDRRGLVRDVSAVLADARLSIDRMTTATRAADQIADMSIAVRVHGLDELEEVLERIRRLPGVVRARRR